MTFKAPAILAPIDKRIRLKVGETVVADSGRAVMLIPPGQHPVYYLPVADFAEGALAALSDSVVPFDGPSLGLEPLVDHVTVAWDAVRWFEEDVETFRHPRNPYVRVDCLPTSRRVQVALGGRHVADSGRAVFLFETGFITRQYMPLEDVAPGLLRPSELRTYCPYKGEAHYYSVALDGQLFENIVWTYPEPYDECRRIGGLVAFYNEKVEAVLIDGEPESRRFTPRI